jgi:predicted oxidoreductase (fatty acid repression mutant protein)
LEEEEKSISRGIIAQTPFGKPTASPDEKQYLPIEDRVKEYK